MMGKSFSPTHYSSQFSNRELAQWSGTSKVSRRDRQLESCCGYEWKNICKDHRQCKMSIDVSNFMLQFFAILSSDLDAITKTLASLLSFLSSECLGELSCIFLQSEKTYTGKISFRQNQKQTYILLKVKIFFIWIHQRKVKNLTMICGLLYSNVVMRCSKS